MSRAHGEKRRREGEYPAVGNMVLECVTKSVAVSVAANTKRYSNRQERPC